MKQTLVLGKFVHAGDGAGLSDNEGEAASLHGKLIMPGITDSHVRITTGAGFEYVAYGKQITCSGKQGTLDFMENRMRRT